MGVCMECLNCKKEMELIDTTYSNIKTDRANIGQHTGDIYSCAECDKMFIDNFLSGKVEDWNY